jgi:uncharacterized metal-binding protein YceD (DUF177 family)
VGKNNKYEILFAGLANGNHTFEFALPSSFFEEFDDRMDDSFRISEGEVTYSVALDKKDHMLSLMFAFEGSVWFPCDKCNDPAPALIEGKRNLHVRFSEEKTWHEDEYMHLPPGAYKIELSDLFYEFIQLALPAKHQHIEGTCNPESLILLQQYLVQEVPESEKSTTDIDPRWEKLKNLKSNK